MNLTFLGHAGLYIRTESTSILCDPWFYPAYLNSWYPLPANDHIDRSYLENADYLFVSAYGQDRFDRKFLSTLNKRITVIVPNFRTDWLIKGLKKLGFEKFLYLDDAMSYDLTPSVKILVAIDETRMYGTVPKSTLAIDDSENRILIQGGRIIQHLDRIATFGGYDLHFITMNEFSWYPSVLDTSDTIKAILNKQARDSLLEESVETIKGVGSRYVTAYGGPHCFLELEKLKLNQFGAYESSSGILSDILDNELKFVENRIDCLSLKYPGTEIFLNHASVTVKEPSAELRRLDLAYSNTELYLESYSKQFGDLRNLVPNVTNDNFAGRNIIDLLKPLIEPLLEKLHFIRIGINGRILVSTETDSVVIDLLDSQVYGHSGQLCRYKLYLSNEMFFKAYDIEGINCFRSLFYSLNFRAETDGFNNEIFYAFLMSLESSNLSALENRLEAEPILKDEIQLGEFLVQRYCPHLKADLSRFGKLDKRVLKCTLHGWEFDLESGRCITQNDRKLFTARKPK